MSIGLQYLAHRPFRRKRSVGRQTEFHMQSQAYFQKNCGKPCPDGRFGLLDHYFLGSRTRARDRNASGPNSSGRIRRSTPISPHHASTAPDQWAFRIVPSCLRRCWKRIFTVQDRAAASSQAGSGLGKKRTMAESTLGCGRKTWGGTVNTYSPRTKFPTHAERAPYVLLPSLAVRRRATSF